VKNIVKNQYKYNNYSFSRHLLLAFILLFAASGNCIAKNSSQSDRFIVHLTESNDTLGSLAEKYLGSADNSWLIAEYNNISKVLPGRLLVIPKGPVDLNRITEEGFHVVPVLCYHRFSDKAAGNKMNMPPEKFRQQMQYLKDNGYVTLSARQMVDYLAGRFSTPKKAVFITMDDGYRSVYTEAFPILKSLGFKATLFIYPTFISTGKAALTWAQLNEMLDYGFDVGAHTMTHGDLIARPLEPARQYEKRLRKEVFEPKMILEKKLETEVITFAYSFGNYDEAVMRAVADAGYEAAFTVVRGSSPNFQWPFLVKRSQIYPNLTMSAFKQNLKTFHKFKIPWKQYITAK